MSRSLRTLTTATLAIILGVGLVGQLGLISPAFATDAASSQGADASSAAGASADASAGSAANAASDAAADGGAGAEASAEADAEGSAGTAGAAGAGDRSESDQNANALANATGDGQGLAGSTDSDPDTSHEPNSNSSDAGADASSDAMGADNGLSEKEEADGARLKAEAVAQSLITAAAGSPLLSDFKAGNLIVDGSFYYSGALNASQIQAFLKQEVPRCEIGDRGKIAGQPAVLNGKVVGTVGPHCLVNMRVNTVTQTSAYCKPYQGKNAETAAQIISKVSVACGISPKVLLAMLEKEQSLVTDTWPTVRQLDYAIGANCPDSGPNNSANCDPKSKGFAVQVYKAGQLLRWYAANNGLNYRPGQYNTIKWHEKDSLGCGSSSVYLENLATASLYTYTPYQPNEAALNAGWGTGNACSSYGNRNFYMYYKLWFGSTRTFFPDVPSGSKFFTEIEWMGKQGHSTGNKTEDSRVTLYEPYNSVTREAMAAFLYRLENSKYKGPKVSPFEDMKPGDKFYDEITWMYKEGLSTGNKNPGGKPLFRPKENVSREAMAAFLYRYEKSTYAGMPTSPFVDVKKGHKFYKEITWMRKTGLSYGNKQPSGQPTYAAYDPVSREAMAAFIYRMQH